MNLDDYEQGAWTPVVSPGVGLTGVTYSGKTGTYTKRGKLVLTTISVRLAASNPPQLKEIHRSPYGYAGW